MSELDSAPQTGGSEPVSDVSNAPDTSTSVEDSIDKAFAEVDAQGESGGDEPSHNPDMAEALEVMSPDGEQQPQEQGNQPLPKGYKYNAAGRLVGPGGKFATLPKEGEQGDTTTEAPNEVAATTAPHRFTPEAKELFSKADPALQTEIARMEQELTGGIEKYRQGAEQWAQLSQFDQMAREHGTTVGQALNNYVQADQMLAQDPVNGVAYILQQQGYSLDQLVDHVNEMRAQGMQAHNPQQSELMQLRSQMNAMQQQIQGYQQAQTQNMSNVVSSEIETFAVSNPRFNEPKILKDVALALELGKADNLPDAFAIAERLNPAPQLASPNTPNAQAQTLKAQASITGAPAAGSNPAGKRAASSSAADAVNNAFAQLGL